MADQICPTQGSGFISLVSSADDLLDDFILPSRTGSTSMMGYINCTTNHREAGSQNNGWVNGCLTQTVAPTFSTSLVDFGNTGRQS